MRHRIFISDDDNQIFESIGGLRFLKTEVWDWLRTNCGISKNDYISPPEPGSVRADRWYSNADTQLINNVYKHGREFIFYDSKDAMLFKLTWL